MGPITKAGVLLVAVLTAAGCTGGGGSRDGGHTTILPDGPIELTIPGDTSLCHGYSEFRSLFEEVALVGRVDLTPGTYLLEYSEASTTTPHPFSMLELGPERRSAIPLDDEAHLLVWAGSSFNDFMEYRWTVDVLFEAGPTSLVLSVVLDSQDGGWPSQVRIDDTGVKASAMLQLVHPVGYENWQYFGLCRPPGPLWRDISALAENGDRIELDVVGSLGWWACVWMSHGRCLALSRASVEIDGQRVEVTDRFHLVYHGGHHNWHDLYLVRLVPPIGQVHAILASDAGVEYYPQDPWLSYLDENLEEIERVPITDWQQVDCEECEPW